MISVVGFGAFAGVAAADPETCYGGVRAARRSGCIWNLDVITTVLPANKALEPIKTKELTQ